MTLIIDTSVALKWAIQEPGSDEALEIATRELMAPDLFQAETGNVLTRKVRARQLSLEQAKLAFRRILARIWLLPSAPFGDQAFDLSLSLDHAIYDCYFLAAAMEHGSLVTADVVFAKKVRARGYVGLIHVLGEELPDD